MNESYFRGNGTSFRKAVYPVCLSRPDPDAPAPELRRGHPRSLEIRTSDLSALRICKPGAKPQTKPIIY